MLESYSRYRCFCLRSCVNLSVVSWLQIPRPRNWRSIPGRKTLFSSLQFPKPLGVSSNLLSKGQWKFLPLCKSGRIAKLIRPLNVVPKPKVYIIILHFTKYYSIKRNILCSRLLSPYLNSGFCIKQCDCRLHLSSSRVSRVFTSDCRILTDDFRSHNVHTKLREKSAKCLNVLYVRHLYQTRRLHELNILSS